MNKARSRLARRSSSHPRFIGSGSDLDAALRGMEGAEEIRVDCEFHSEGRYHPMLCLVQVGWRDEDWAIDALQVDLEPLAPWLENEAVRKLVHDGRNDLPLLTRATGADDVRNVFDTRVASGFLGFGHISYTDLAQQICGVELEKSLQVSNWEGPLSDAQLEYALNDVRYLGRVAQELRARLVERGRLAWVEEACLASVSKALRADNPTEAYRRVQRSKLKTGEQLGILRALAAWRELAAADLDKPLRSVASDEALVQMSLFPPANRGALASVRGLGAGRGEPWGARLIEAARYGATRPLPDPTPPQRDRDQRMEGVLAMLTLVRRIVGDREGITPELLADHADVAALAEWHFAGRPEGETLELLAGWRKEMVGEVLLDVLASNQVVQVDLTAGAGLVLRPPA